MGDPITTALIVGGIGLGGKFLGSKLFGDGGGSKSESTSRTLETVPVPQVAGDSAAKKRRRIGRNALIFSDQENILGETPSISRNELIAF